jgi:hypothetical protein
MKWTLSSGRLDRSTERASSQGLGTCVVERLEQRLTFSVTVFAGPILPPEFAARAAAANGTANDVALQSTAGVPLNSTAAVTGGTELGGNLQAQNVGTQDKAFADLIKSSSGFEKLSGGATTVDANGWPTTDFKVTLSNNVGYVPIAAGRYNISFNGPSLTTVGPNPVKTGLKITKVSYNSTTKLHRYTMDVPSGTVVLGLRFTRTSGQVKNLKVVQPGYDPLKPPVFTTKYVNMIKALNPDTLRLMEFTKTQDSKVSTWSQRSKPTDAVQKNGVAWEYAIQLANTVGSNVWVNIPGRANDDYVRQLAILLKNTLRSDLKIYVEYANEVWALNYDQARYNYTSAVQEVIAAYKAGKQSDLNYDNLPVDTTITDYKNPNAEKWGDRRTVRRSKQISDIFKSVWTSAGQPDPINNRVTVVLGGQASRLSRFNNMIDYGNAVLGPLKNYLGALGVAPYFGMNLYGDHTVNGQWSTLRTDLTPEDVLEGMRRSIESYNTKPFLTDANAMADANGLKLFAYETGPDTMGPFNITAKKRASLDPRIKPLMAQYLNQWYRAGGDLAAWYTIGARSYDTQFGTWTLTNDINNTNTAKAQAFRAIRDAAPGQAVITLTSRAPVLAA